MTPRLPALPASLLALNPRLAAAAAFSPASAPATARAKGSAAHAAGKLFEAAAADAFAALAAGGTLAHWTWTGPPTRRAWQNGRLVLVATGPAPCDVVAIAADGRALVAEVKRAGHRLDLHAGIGPNGQPEAGLQPHQRAMLDAAEDAGAVALLVVEIAGVRAVLPWAEARALKGIGVRVARAWACDLAAGIRDLIGPVAAAGGGRGGG